VVRHRRSIRPRRRNGFSEYSPAWR
jgi:hypothetical protein